MKGKAFFIIFEGLSLKQIKIFFLEGESPTLTQRATKTTLLIKFCNQFRFGRYQGIEL